MTDQQVAESIKSLPEEGQGELASFLEYLRFKYQSQTGKHRSRGKVKQIKDLKGILKGYDFSPELISQVRRETWAGFGRERLMDLPKR